MVRLTVAVSASTTRQAQELLATFRFLLASVRFEPGCRGCSTWVDADSKVHYEEEWETEADTRRRVRSSEFTSLLAAVESGDQPPLLQFDFVTTMRGLDYVAEVRGEG
jgi:quinol monooxygenase YgiN